MMAEKSNVFLFAPEEASPMLQNFPVDPLTPTIFHEPWWLDIVTAGNYNVVEVQDNGRTVGRLPYFPKRRFGVRYNVMPALTHFIGPAVVEGEGHHTTRFLRRTQVMRELLRKLPAAAFYKYKCHRGITDAIAFQQENFLTNVQFTYEIPSQDEDLSWKNMRVEKRKKIRQAQKIYTVTDIQDAQEFWHFYDGNYRKRGVVNGYEQKVTTTLVQACVDRGRGKIYAARDSNNNLAAAILCVWDATSSFYFMSTRAPDAHNGAISLLAWEAIKDASARGLIFDFDGLVSSSAVLFFTEFGGAISPRFIATRQTIVGGIVLGAKEMFREDRYFY